MSRSRPILAATLLAAVAVGVVIVVVKVGKTRRVATQVADGIEAELRDLNPVTRAAVVGKLSADALRDLRSHRA